MAKKILEIVPSVNFARGFIINRMAYMGELGYDMHLTCPNDPLIRDISIKSGIHYYALDINRLISVFSDIKCFIRICDYIKKNHIDCVVGHADKGTLFAALAGLFTGAKVITFIHGTSFETRRGLPRKLFVFVDWFQSLLSDKNICVSPFLVELRTNLHISPKSKQVVPNIGSCCGIDCEKFNPNRISTGMKLDLRNHLGIRNDDFVIGFCGRFTKDKGVDKLVEAFTILNKFVREKFILLLIGSNDIRDILPMEVLDMIKENKRIICPGYITECIEVYYSIMDVFVLPTRRDGFGMCLIEAAAMGIPVLSSPLTGSRDAMSVNHNGEYIDIDENDIARKILHLYDNPQLRREYGKYGVDWVKHNFDKERIFNAIADSYSDVI